MPLGTLDRVPPPFFRQGPSALSKLAVCGALAIFLMVADARFQMMRPLRVVVATVLYPVQWVVLQPVLAGRTAWDYLNAAAQAETVQEQARRRLSEQALRSHQVESLKLENRRLRALLELAPRLSSQARGASVLYDAADPYTRKVIVDKGMAHGVRLGSPALDEFGVLGQVTQVYPLVSEVTLVTDRDHAIPVLNTRTGARGVAFGDTVTHMDALELRYTAANADVAVGDLLTTSGVDGVYPPGLPVARVEKVDRQVDAMFARIYCVPLAKVSGAEHMLLLDPIEAEIAARPVDAPKEEKPASDGKLASKERAKGVR